MIGILLMAFRSCTLANNGLSKMRTRMNIPIPSSKMPNRNGTRQPQRRKSSSGSREKIANTPAANSSPAGTPICTHPP
jgi:hypothetical protein